MSTPELKALVSNALKLSPADRETLAFEVLDSLRPPASPDTAEAWDEEIVRRINQIKSGNATLLSVEELRARMRARLG